MEVHGPSALGRLLFAVYMAGLQQVPKGPRAGGVPSPWVWLMVGLLSVHTASLWSGRVNLRVSVERLEAMVVYGGLLSGAQWFAHEEDLVMSTAAGLYLGWHVARVMSSLWVHVGLCLYFGVVVPLVWRGRDQEGYSSMAWLLCDASLVVSQALVAAYPALLEALF